MKITLDLPDSTLLAEIRKLADSIDCRLTVAQDGSYLLRQRPTSAGTHHVKTPSRKGQYHATTPVRWV